MSIDLPGPKPKWPVPAETNIDLPTFHNTPCPKCGDAERDLIFCKGWVEPDIETRDTVFGKVTTSNERCGIAGEHMHWLCKSCGFIACMQCKDASP